MPKKKLIDFDFSRFDCQEEDVRDLVEAMGFEIAEEVVVVERGVIAVPGMVLDHQGSDGLYEAVVVTLNEYEKSGLGTLDSDQIPYYDGESDYEGIDGHAFKHFTTRDGAPIIGYRDDAE